MVRIKNQKAIVKISENHLHANRVRNLVAVCAIMLTSMLFMALFTIAGIWCILSSRQRSGKLAGICRGRSKTLH